ncbi:hypothetical protein D3C79_1095540 [compost metagenome]
MLLDGGDRNAKTLSSRYITQAFELHGQKDLPGAFTQAVEQGVHCHQGFEDQQAGFG